MEVTMETKVVLYFRVSTKRQGLGLDAQQKVVADYLAQHPEIKVIGEFTEKHTGKEQNRPQFKEAIALCKRSGATLLSAKLDRLGRGKFLYTMLGDSSVKFNALDITGGSELEKSIKVAIAIQEGLDISDRTSKGLMAKGDYLTKAREAYENGDIDKAKEWVFIAETRSPNTRIKRGFDWWRDRDFKLGTKRKLNDSEINTLSEARTYEANNDDANLNASNAVRDYLNQGGKMNYSAIAQFLNDNNYRTRRGKSGWKPQSVKNLIERFNLI